MFKKTSINYCRTHYDSVCLYIAYIACGSASLYIKALYFFLTVLALSAAATVANIKIRYDAKTPQFAIFGTRVIYVFYSICFIKAEILETQWCRWCEQQKILSAFYLENDRKIFDFFHCFSKNSRKMYWKVTELLLDSWSPILCRLVICLLYHF